MKNGSILWGILLVLLGGLLLLENMGILPRSVNVWSLFWPVVLIGMGIRGVLAALNRGSGGKTETLAIPLENSRTVHVKMRHGAGELRVNDSASSGNLLEGSFMGGVQHEMSRSGDDAFIELRVPDNVFPWPGDSGNRLDWVVGFHRETPLILDLQVGASRNILDFRNLQLKELRISTGASATDIELPANAGSTKLWMESGAAGVDIRVPQGVAARIRARGALAGINVDSLRFPQNGDVYQSVDYDTAQNRVDVEVTMGVGSVNVR